MRAAWIIARLTVAEAARRRILWVLLALTLLSVLLTTWGVERLVTLAREGDTPANEIEIQVGVSQVLILVAFMFSFVLAMTAAFLGAPSIASDLESGVAHAMLARPIRRADLVVGRWIGLAAIVIAYASLSGLLEVAAVRLVSGYSPPQPWLAVVFLSGQAIVLLTFAMLLSTRLPAIASGAVCVVLFGLGWMAGVFAGIGRFFDAGPLGRGGGGVALAAAVRRPLARDDLRARTVGRHRRDRRGGRPESRGEPILRVDPTADRVHRLVGRVDRGGAGPGDVVVVEARSIAT